MAARITRTLSRSMKFDPNNPYESSAIPKKRANTKRRPLGRAIATGVLGGLSLLPLLLGFAWVFVGATGGGTRPHRAEQILIVGVVSVFIGIAGLGFATWLFLDRKN